MIKAFFIALGLLTRFPIAKRFQLQESDDEKLYGWSVLYYPVIGLIIGGLLVIVSWSLSLFELPGHGLIEAGLLLSLWVLVTGALHLDGLADSADAWLGGYGDKLRSLEIMKDPRSGPAAVVVLILVLLLKFSALINVSWQALLLAPVIARTSVMILFGMTPYVRKGGMGDSATRHLPKTAMWVVLLIVFAFIILLLKQQSGYVITLLLIAYLLRKLMLKRIEGTTGDTAGAMLEVMEVSTLLLIVFINIK